MIDKNKQYKTRNGLPVRIYATDCGGSCPVHGAILMDGNWIHLSWFSDGKFMVHMLNDRDLIEVKPRIQRTEWFNIYPDGAEGGYKTRKEADKYAGQIRIACIQIPIDCEGGEGL